MSLQILDIVLYGPFEEPRVVTLKPGQLNIITGSSKSGKSALVPIVDYCLGAGECAVAYGPIRSTVAWYALRLVAGEKQIFIARRAPEKGFESNGDVHYEVAAKVEIPLKSALSQNMNVATAVELLSQDTGIVDNRHEPPPGQTRPPLAATINHALSFCFQRQFEIISPTHLFYRQTDHWVAQALQDALPYFIGAIGDDHIVKMQRLRQLRHEHRKLAQRFAEAKAIRGKGTGRAEALLRESIDLGLVVAPAAQLNYDDTMALLTAVLDRQLPTATDRTVDGSDAYEELVEKRERLTQQLRRTEEDARGARSLIGERKGFAKEAEERAGRLRSIGLLPPSDEQHSCPLCASQLSEIPTTSALARSLATLERQLGDVAQGNPHLEKLTARLEEQAAQLRSQLAENRQALEGLQRQRNQVAEYREFLGRAAHVRGRISIYLEAAPTAASGVDDLAIKEQALSDQIRDLEEELSQSAVEERLASTVSVVSSHITETGRTLELEHSENPLRFIPKKLSLVADTPTGVIPMPKMGGGANWVGYHLVVLFALHRQFVEANRPVPRFLFLDQPSQVYFPADRDTAGLLEVSKDGQHIDEDRMAVLRIFEFIRDQVSERKQALQVILVEHADPAVEWYSGAVVGRWRGGVKLIPPEWIAALNVPETSQDSSNAE